MSCLNNAGCGRQIFLLAIRLLLQCVLAGSISRTGMDELNAKNFHASAANVQSTVLEQSPAFLGSKQLFAHLSPAGKTNRAR